MGIHRADIVTPSGLVIELQHSSIPVDEITERERFYQNMIWLIDAESFKSRFCVRQRDGYWTFLWIRPRLHIAAMTFPVFLDGIEPGMLFRVKKIHTSGKCAGWGYFIPTWRFIYTHFKRTA
jgi:hypothetical protein